MGAFDDLIPASQSANPGAFDDLIPAKPSGGLAAAAKQAIGSTIKGAGRAAADFIPGVTPANPIRQYGQEVIDANPTAVQSFGDIADKPWTAVKEAVGNAGGSMAGMLGARALGTGITMAAPFTGPAAPLVGLAGQAIANVGPFVAAALPSYGGIREEQIKTDPANEADAKSKAIAMLGAGAVGAIEGAYGPQAWALAAAKKGGIEALVKQFADAKSIPAAIGKGIMRGGAIEGAEELVQNPIEQVASYQDPTTRQAIGETLFGGAMGAIGGGVMGGGMAGAAKALAPVQQNVPPPAESPTVAPPSTAPTTAVPPNVSPQPTTVAAPIEINPAAGPLQNALFTGGTTSVQPAPAPAITGATNEPNEAQATGDDSGSGAAIGTATAPTGAAGNESPAAGLGGIAQESQEGTGPAGNQPATVAPTGLASVVYADPEFMQLAQQEAQDVDARRHAMARRQAVIRSAKTEAADGRVQSQRIAQAASNRQDILDSLPLMRFQNPVSAFEAALSRAGITQSSATADERAQIAKRIDAESVLLQDYPVEQLPALPNEMAAPSRGLVGTVAPSRERTAALIGKAKANKGARIKGDRLLDANGKMLDRISQDEAIALAPFVKQQPQGQQNATETQVTKPAAPGQQAQPAEVPGAGVTPQLQTPQQPTSIAGPLAQTPTQMPIGKYERATTPEKSGVPENPAQPGRLRADDVTAESIKGLIGKSLALHEWDVDNGGKVKARVKVTTRNGLVNTAYLHVTIINPNGSWTYYREKPDGGLKEVSSGRGQAPAATGTEAPPEPVIAGKTGAPKPISSRISGLVEKSDATRLAKMAMHENKAIKEAARAELERRSATDKDSSLVQSPNSESATPVLVKSRTVYGNYVHVRQSDLDGTRKLLPTFSANGDRIAGANSVIHRENLDPDGSKQQAMNQEFTEDVIGADRGRKAFATVAAAKREAIRRGVTETHEVIPAGEVSPGTGGFVLRKKKDAAPATGDDTNTAPEAPHVVANETTPGETQSALPVAGETQPVPDAKAERLAKLAAKRAESQAKRENLAVAAGKQAEATHIEGNATEEATAPVIAQAIKKGASNSGLDLRQEQANLLKAIDVAISKAPTDDAPSDTVTFDVPGDGKFKITNSKPRLEWFRGKIAAMSKGFSPIPKPAKHVSAVAKIHGGKASDQTIRDMLNDGDLTAALELSKVIGKKLVFGNYDATKVVRPVAHTDAQKFAPAGFESFEMVSSHEMGSSSWRIIELSTGLSIASGRTRATAESAAADLLKRRGPQKLAESIEQNKEDGRAKDQATLEAEWIKWAEKEEHDKDHAAEIADDAKKAMAKARASDIAKWAELTGSEAPKNANPFDPILMTHNAIKEDYDQATKNGKGDEFLDYAESKLDDEIPPHKQILDFIKRLRMGSVGGWRFVGNEGAGGIPRHEKTITTSDGREIRATIDEDLSAYGMVRVDGAIKVRIGKDGESLTFMQAREQADKAIDALMKPTESVTSEDEPQPAGTRIVGSSYFGGSVEKPIYGLFKEGDRIRDKQFGHRGVVDALKTKGNVVDGYVVKMDNGMRMTVLPSALVAESSEEKKAAEPAPSEPQVWHTKLPTTGMPITEAQKKSGGYSAVPHALAADAYAAVTQDQKMGGSAMYAYYLPAADGLNGIVRLLPDDQTPPAPWKLLNGEALRPHIQAKELIEKKLAEWLRSAPVVGNEDTAPKTDSDNTKDSGSELTYNRRNRLNRGLKWDDIVDQNAALRVKEVVKAKVYPKPDYQSMVDGGMPPIAAHLVKQVYDSMAVSPQIKGKDATDDDLKLYIDAINRVMAGTEAWAKDKTAVAAWAEKSAKVAAAMLGKPAAPSGLEQSKSLLDTVYPGGWKAYQAELVIIGGNKVLDALQPGYKEASVAVRETNKGWPASRESWQLQGFKVLATETAGAVRNSRGRGIDDEAYIVFDGEYFKSYPNKAAAESALAEFMPFLLMDKRGRIVGQYDTKDQATEAARSASKKASNDTAIKEEGRSVDAAERIGQPRRAEGENVSSDRLKETFGFKGINFGNWMKGDTPAKTAERQLHLNHAYDAFLDLAEIIGVPPRAMSLNGMLGLAIGAQGGGKALAHFVPGVNEINLTYNLATDTKSSPSDRANLQHGRRRQDGSRNPLVHRQGQPAPVQSVSGQRTAQPRGGIDTHARQPGRLAVWQYLAGTAVRGRLQPEDRHRCIVHGARGGAPHPP
jgi:hypothetical protein